MSAATVVLETLAARGAVVTVRADVLRIEPRAVIDEPLRAEIRANKTELLELLDGTKKRPASTCRALFNVGEAYDRKAARDYAHQLHERGEVTDAQRDQLLAYAEEAN